MGDRLKSVPRAASRVLFIDHTAIMGGGEIALLNLVRHIDRSRFAPMVLLFSEGPLAEELRRDTEVHVMPLRSEIAGARKDSLGVKSLLQIRDVLQVMWFVLRVRRFIRRQRIDLVHTNSLKADIIGGIAARLAFRPVVWHVRDRITADYLPAMVANVFRKLARVIPAHVIANSEATMKTLYLDPAVSTAVPSGVDLDRVRVERASLDRAGLDRASIVHDGTLMYGPAEWVRSEAWKMGLIGRISPWKGQDVFLKAAAIVHEEFREARFSIIGAALFGEQAYEEEVRRLADELGLEGVVEFTGFCRDVTAKIRELDVVVHASTTGEPFGQVIIEGMAAGKPVVATNGGGVPEIVVDGVTGVLVPMSDAGAMAAAMKWMIGHPAEAMEMGRQGRERVLARFTVQGSTAKVEAVFGGVLAAASGKSV